MSTKGLDHVAIAVKDLDVAVKYYVEVLGFPPPEIEVVEEQKVTTAIFGHGMGRIELICPTDPTSAVAKFLEKRGEGLHHVCVEVSDIEATLAGLKAQGAQLIDQSPKIGAGGAKIAFVHPKGAHGVLTELRQGRPTRE
ncbi:MAG: methylmalonyl-CoA epimerase [Myxococcaceae bacterium]|nr:methylmalonyl-CoA epimerase [Myxococcaceae bacterium]